MNDKQPEELARVQNPRKICENCKKPYIACGPRQLYCIACRPEMQRQYDKNYYSERGSYQRKRKRRIERIDKESKKRKCATPDCANAIFGTAKKKYCSECIHERRLERKRKARHDRKNSSRSTQKLARHEAETNDDQSADPRT